MNRLDKETHHNQMNRSILEINSAESEENNDEESH